MPKKTAGIVLAGGRSSRMGQNKALMDYRGRPLVDHMTSLLQQSGIEKSTYISGNLDGYQCIPDNAEFPGPAKAMAHIMRSLKSFHYFLFIPVDMPLLTPDILQQLMQHNKGAYFENHPLPAFIKPPPDNSEACSVKKLLHNMNINSLPLPAGQEHFFANLNTQEDYKEKVTA